MEQNKKPKIAVVGPGAMGLLFAGRLSAHADVTLLGIIRNASVNFS